MGRHEEAEALYKQALAIFGTALGSEHLAYARTLHEIAWVRQAMGRHAEAEALYEQALAIEKTALGEAHPHAILGLASLASCRACLGSIDAARDMFESSRARAESLSEGATLWTGRVRLEWAHGLLGAGLREEAGGEARAARDLLAEALGPQDKLVRESDKLIEASSVGD